jgi:hypothetical protein
VRGPGSLEITTTIGCRINCRFCPQETLLRRYGGQGRARALDLAGFAGYLAKVPPDVKIHFSGMSEPWLNPACTEMLLLAAGRGHAISVYSTLAGMSGEDFERIRGLRFGHFVTHLPDAEGNSPIPLSADYLKLLARVLDADLDVATARHASCHGKPAPEVAALLRGRFAVADTMLDRAGNLSEGTSVARPLRGPITCRRAGRLLNRNVLLPDGTVVLCCMDYGLQHVLGNLADSTYGELLGGAEAARVRAAMDDDRLPLLCRRCTVARPLRSG